MEITRQNDGVVKLSGELHIGDSEGLRTALLGELAAALALVVDLSQVESCDAASFQLLCSAGVSARKSGKGFRISEPSAAVREASAILGVSLEDLAASSNTK